MFTTPCESGRKPVISILFEKKEKCINEKDKIFRIAGSSERRQSMPKTIPYAIIYIVLGLPLVIISFIPKVKEKLKGSQGIMLLCGGFLIISGMYYLLSVMIK
jgi:hypothetical protein